MLTNINNNTYNVAVKKHEDFISCKILLYLIHKIHYCTYYQVENK